MLLLLTLVPIALIGFVASEINDDDDDPVISTEPSAGNDQITGTSGNDDISALEGDDILTGGPGDDTLDGAQGNDIVVGDGGLDQIRGGDGIDLLLGRGGADEVSGNAGNDWVEGDGGDDTVTGGQGDDLVFGGEGDDVIIGGNGNDLLVDGVLTGTPLDTDALVQLRAGTFAEDVLGNDLIVLTEDGDADILNGNNGDDAIVFGQGDQATGEGGIDNFAVVAGGADTGLGPAQITDFDPLSETLSIIIDNASTSTEETVSVVTDGSDAVVQFNGVDVVTVIGAAGVLSASDIAVFDGLAASRLQL